VTDKPSAETRRGGADLILCVVQRGHADTVAKAAVKAGAKGATIFFARGMGARDQLGLLGLAIVPEKETVLIVCLEHETRVIFDAIVEAGHLHTPGMGIAIVVPIRESAGVLGVDFTGAAASAS
jgi:nitrogen regulatory protein P-II 1